MLSAQSSQVSDDKLYVDDVFSAYTYIGNGSTLAINNGIDLAGKGGMVWQKNRDLSASHFLVDTVRGVEKGLSTNSTNGQSTYSGLLTSFASNGFDLGAYNNNSLQTYVSWTFRKAPKFFDVVTYTGDGVAGRAVAHNLTQAPGMIIVKTTNSAADWRVWHRSNSYLNGTQAAQGCIMALNLTVDGAGGAYSETTYFPTLPTASMFSVSSNHNLAGVIYVAYLFAHDTSTDGIIQCGSFTTDAGGNATVNLGWEPQYVITKKSSITGDWVISDASRGAAVDSNSPVIYANTSAAEFNGSNAYRPNATGFSAVSGGVSVTHIYMAIRRPNKPPTSGTQVYNAIARTGNGSTTGAAITGVGFAPDFSHTFLRSGGNYHAIYDRLRGGNIGMLDTSGITAESALATTLKTFDQDGVTVVAATTGSGTVATNGDAQTYINHFFKRAPGVFDIVCYTGTGAIRAINHSLGVAPQLMIVRSRTLSGNAYWVVYSEPLGAAYSATLQSTSAFSNASNYFETTAPTETVFTLSANGITNGTGHAHVAYLFATKTGISKVGNYTGNGSTQAINCGFTTGARFILIKRTDVAGNWYCWDTARGIIAGNDPHLSLNSTVAEVTGEDSIDPNNSGFIVNQVSATNINVSAASYIYLAFA